MQARQPQGVPEHCELILEIGAGCVVYGCGDENRAARAGEHLRLPSPSGRGQQSSFHKNRTRHQDGFKVHASLEPETGGYGPGNHEAAVAFDLLADEDGGLTVLGDSAYGTGDLRAQLQADGHILVPKPPAPPPDGVPRCGVRDQRPGVRGRLPGAHFHG
jgi:hypothetical protein